MTEPTSPGAGGRGWRLTVFCITMSKDSGIEVIPMAAMTVTTKGQVTIPKEIRDLLGIQPGDRVVFFRSEDGRVVVQPENVDVRRLRGLLKHHGEAVTLEQMDEAIARGAAGSTAP
jgi:antitoxin PrlF